LTFHLSPEVGVLSVALHGEYIPLNVDAELQLMRQNITPLAGIL
jgi:hypothetical protein